MLICMLSFLPVYSCMYTFNHTQVTSVAVIIADRCGKVNESIFLSRKGGEQSQGLIHKDDQPAPIIINGQVRHATIRPLQHNSTFSECSYFQCSANVKKLIPKSSVRNITLMCAEKQYHIQYFSSMQYAATQTTARQHCCIEYKCIETQFVTFQRKMLVQCSGNSIWPLCLQIHTSGRSAWLTDVKEA